MSTPANPDDLLAWLRAQIDDDEEAASDAAGLGNFRRHWKREAISCVVDATDNGLIVYGEGTPTPEQADHIARHDPARVLAEVDAKRRILDYYAEMNAATPNGWDDSAAHAAAAIENALRLLALPFADREGFREEWRP